MLQIEVHISLQGSPEECGPYYIDCALKKARPVDNDAMELKLLALKHIP
jgi:hypothetical protein